MKKENYIPRVFLHIRVVLACILWTYWLCYKSVCILDGDGELLLDLFLCGCMCVLLFVFRGLDFFVNSVFYIFFYPVVLVFYIFDSFLGGVMSSVFSILGYFGFIKNVKYNIIIFCFFIFSCVAIYIGFDNKLIVLFSVVYIFVYVFLNILRLFFRVYSSRSVINSIRKCFVFVRDFILKSISDEKKNMDFNVKKNGWVEVFVLHVFLKVGIYFESKIGFFKNGNKYDVFLQSLLLYKFFLYGVCFGFAYFGLRYLDFESFSGGKQYGIINFIGFSFDVMMTSSISGISPSSGWAQFLCYSELFVSFMFAFCFVFIFLTSMREIGHGDISDFMTDLKDSNASIAARLERNYKYSSDDIKRMFSGKEINLIDSAFRKLK